MREGRLGESIGRVLQLLLLALLTACQRQEGAAAHRALGGGAGADTEGPLVVFAAGSLARPMRAALDSFALHTGRTYTLESAGSLELARKMTDLNRRADVVALADEDVFPRFLMPSHVRWYARFARNQMVLAYASKARAPADIANWTTVLTRPGVDVGRSDPDLDPAGYRTLLLFQLAEQHYKQPGLARRLERNAARRNIRPKSAELVAMLQAGELDYAWMYESSARAARLPFIPMPDEINLGREDMAGRYHVASVRVLGATIGETLEVRGAPIRYGLSVPSHTEHRAASESFLAYLLSDAGRRALAAEYLDASVAPVVVGDSIPTALKALLTQASRPDSSHE